MYKKPMLKDERAVVLDFLAHGHYGMRRAEPVAYVIGDKYFSLLEVIVREDLDMKLEDRVYIGDAKRDEVKYIRKRIGYDELTAAAKEELEPTLENIIKKDRDRFLDFFNRAGPVNARLHQLELLPGIGKRHLWDIIEKRKEKTFESFEEVKKRVPLMPNPEKLVVKRIMLELQNSDKYRIFVPRFERDR